MIDRAAPWTAVVLRADGTPVAFFAPGYDASRWLADTFSRPNELHVVECQEPALTRLVRETCSHCGGAGNVIRRVDEVEPWPDRQG